MSSSTPTKPSSEGLVLHQSQGRSSSGRPEQVAEAITSLPASTPSISAVRAKEGVPPPTVVQVP